MKTLGKDSMKNLGMALPLTFRTPGTAFRFTAKPKGSFLPVAFDCNELPVDTYLSRYLIHSYLYYKLDTSIITDHEFDALASWLVIVFPFLTSPHKALVDFPSLKKTPSAFYIKTYPSIVAGSAHWLLNYFRIHKKLP